jgi:signal transduction histidine kinase
LSSRRYGSRGPSPRARGTPAEPPIAEARAHVECGLAELRDLAHGIHPAVLRDRGLAAAPESLAARAPLPVAPHVTGARAAQTVEAAMYLSVAEAFTNVAKHARATTACVTVEIADGTLSREVVDDGVGGAAATSGSGLHGLADRIEALGGTLSIDSPRGGPTRIRAQLPLQGSCTVRSPTIQLSPASSDNLTERRLASS